MLGTPSYKSYWRAERQLTEQIHGENDHIVELAPANVTILRESNIVEPSTAPAKLVCETITAAPVA